MKVLEEEPASAVSPVAVVINAMQHLQERKKETLWYFKKIIKTVVNLLHISQSKMITSNDVFHVIEEYVCRMYSLTSSDVNLGRLENGFGNKNQSEAAFEKSRRFHYATNKRRTPPTN